MSDALAVEADSNAASSLRRFGQNLLGLAVFALSALLVWWKSYHWGMLPTPPWVLWTALLTVPALAFAASVLLFALARILEPLKLQRTPQPSELRRLQRSAGFFWLLAMLAPAAPWIPWFHFDQGPADAWLAICCFALLCLALLPAWQLSVFVRALRGLCADETPQPAARSPVFLQRLELRGPWLLGMVLMPCLLLTLTPAFSELVATSTSAQELAGIVLLALFVLLYFAVWALLLIFLELQNRFLRALLARQQALRALCQGQPDIAMSRPQLTGLHTTTGVMQIVATVAAVLCFLLACGPLLAALAFGFSGLFGLNARPFSGLVLNFLCLWLLGTCLLALGRSGVSLTGFWQAWLQRQDAQVSAADLGPQTRSVER